MILNKLTSTILNLINPDDKIVLGLSGGADSVFLFHLLLKIRSETGINFIAAHFDHKWRENSWQDLEFCKKLCEKHNVEFFSSNPNELGHAVKFNGSTEELGRKLRLHFFNKIAKEENANLIALAHHADDQQETFLMRLIRGTSLSGIVCMSLKNGNIIRPLLGVSKSEILSYLNENKIDFLIDSTNSSDLFLRNRIRNHVIPTLEKCDTRFKKNLNSTLTHLQEEDGFLNELAKTTLDNLIIDADSTKIDRTQFLLQHPVIQKRLLIILLCKAKVKFSPTNCFLEEILRFLAKSEKSNSHQISQNSKIIKTKNSFFIDSSQNH